MLRFRFNRYKITRGYNSAINFRQFPASGTGIAILVCSPVFIAVFDLSFLKIGWAKDYRYPDIWYADKMELTVGDEVFELFHDKGETDDSTWYRISLIYSEWLGFMVLPN